MKYLKPVIILIILTYFQGFLMAQIPDSTLNLSLLIQEALQNNPELTAIQQESRAAQTRVPQAGALPDPKLKIGLMNLPVDSWAFDREPMSGKQISLMQAIPFPGKLGLQTEIAGLSAEISDLQFREAQNRLKKQIKTTYFELFYIDKAIETNEKNAALIKQFTGIAEARYRVGKGLQQDVLKAQVEYSKISNTLIDLRQQRKTLAAEINFLLNQPADNPFGKTAEIDETDFDDTTEELKAAAENRPLLVSWKNAVNQSEQKIKLSRKGYLPDFSLELAYTQRDELLNGSRGIDFFSGMVSLNLPVYFWKKQQKNVEENRLQKNALTKRLESIRQQIYRDVEINLEQLISRKKQLELFKTTIIPQASQALQSALSAYQVDKVEFLTLVDNQLTLFNHELSYYRLLSDYRINIANLVFLTGKELVTIE